MDQFASMMGEEGKVMMLDCRSMEFHYFPLPLENHALVLCDTKVKHSLVDSAYNTRRQECERGVQVLQHYAPGIKSLRDVPLTLLKQHEQEFEGQVYSRCLYVVEEIQRVQEAGQDLLRHDLTAFGKKMYETHTGLSTLYGVSCEELDFLVDHARAMGTVLGARMMGGGFGGCTINIVSRDNVAEFIASTAAAYRKAFGIELEAHVVQIKAGTSVVPLTAG
jgi:galactokinase